MKKIAIFQQDLKMGGIQKSLLNLLNRMDNYKIDLYLFNKGNFFEAELPSNVNIIYLKPFNKIYKLIPFNIVKKIKKINIKKEYDITIDFNGYSNECAIGALNAKSKKTVIWCHNDIIIKYKNEWKYRVLFNNFKSKYKYFDNIINVSEGAMNSFIDKTKIDCKKVIYIPNYINTKEIINKSLENIELELNESTYNLIAVGRICKQKGFDILINYMEKIIEKNKKINLYIIGDGPDKEKIQKIINKKNLQNYIFLLGGQANPYKYMSKMDGFILTSRYEGQGIVALEALTLGLDIFVTKNLQKYLPEIDVTDNIIEEVINAKKEEKSTNNLDEYNKKIDIKISNLIEGD